MEGNYIKINRSILSWEWYGDINTCRLFIHMLLKANWREGRFRGTTVPRGSFVSSIAKLSEETKLTNDEVRTAILHLVNTGEITKQSTNKFTVFTVKNYDLYQDSPNQDADQSPVSPQTIPKLFPTIEEREKEKEGKKEMENNMQSAMYSCPEREFLSIPLKDGNSYIVTTDDVEDYKKSYPLVNVEQEIRSMRRWCIDNPRKKKTMRGVKRFINGWLSREQARREERAAVQQAKNRELEAWVNEEK
ncbi:MAG TPA: hypothetical protein IAB61_01785 [Candidatus Merdisoma merdipullorum]|nr:hypothetical protein [Candidatus Merdisoma merdipullorum]